jgi:hypothetical protein
MSFKISKITDIILPLFFLCILTCSNKKAEGPCPVTLNVSGKATVTAPHKDKTDAARGMSIPDSSLVTTGDSSGIIIGLNGTRYVAAVDNSYFIPDYLMETTAKPFINVNLLAGTIICFIPAHVIPDSMTGSINIRTTDHAAVMSIQYERPSRIVILKTLAGTADILIGDSLAGTIPSCSKIMIGSNGSLSKILQLHDKDYLPLIQSAGQDFTDSMINATGCLTRKNMETGNQPPQWEKTPRGTCFSNERFCDTLEADDPEGAPISYRLTEAPKKMLVDPVSGIITFFPKKAGDYQITAEAVDSGNLSVTMTYKLIVKNRPTADTIIKQSEPTEKHDTLPQEKSEPVSISIEVPDTAATNTSVSAQCVIKGKANFTEFGWDFEGNNSYKRKSDKPAQSFVYTKEGKYTIMCFASNDRDETFSCKHDIVIIDKTIQVKAGGHYKTAPGSPVSLQGNINASSNKAVSYTWYFDGGSKADTVMKSNMPVTHSYRKAGIHHAVLVVTDKDNKEWRDTADVEVINTPPKAAAGKDVLSRPGRNIKLRGTAEDRDDGIVLYEWDFDGDGKYDWSSQKNTPVKHEFNVYSRPVFRVTDFNGATASDTVSIVICPDDMVSVENGPFCIDRYEWPNKKGQTPLTGLSREDAAKKCSETGKYLCGKNEWQVACSNGKKKYYPHSNSPDEQNCNVIGNKEYKNVIAPSGVFSDCASPAGAYDMNGNVAEWTSGSDGGNAYVYGGSWHNDIADASCSSNLSLNPKTGYFYVGFRCCK